VTGPSVCRRGDVLAPTCESKAWSRTALPLVILESAHRLLSDQLSDNRIDNRTFRHTSTDGDQILSPRPAECLVRHIFRFWIGAFELQAQQPVQQHVSAACFQGRRSASRVAAEFALASISVVTSWSALPQDSHDHARVHRAANGAATRVRPSR
jgi:hypothetical protein